MSSNRNLLRRCNYSCIHGSSLVSRQFREEIVVLNPATSKNRNSRRTRMMVASLMRCFVRCCGYRHQVVSDLRSSCIQEEQQIILTNQLCTISRNYLTTAMMDTFVKFNSKKNVLKKVRVVISMNHKPGAQSKTSKFYKK